MIRIKTINHKIHTTRVLIAALLLISLACLSIVPVQADNTSVTIYAIECGSSTVGLSNNTLSCSASPELPKVEGVGGVDSPYPSGAGIATVTVQCGPAGPNQLKVGDQASFTCPPDFALHITDLKQIQQGTIPAASDSGSGSSLEGCGTSDTGPCGSNNCGNGGCVGSSPDSAACAANPTIAGCSSNSQADCSSSGCDLIQKYLNPIINLFSGLFGLIAVVSLIVGGIQYSASEGDPQKASQAKNRIAKTVFAIFAYFFMYAFLQFIVPGGIFNRS